MYSFQAGGNRRKNKRRVQILGIVIFLLIVALIGVTVAYLRVRQSSAGVSEALLASAINEAGQAREAAYQLTQTSGSKTMSVLSNVKAHIYALRNLNTLTSNIYGAGTVVVDGELLTTCLRTIETAELKQQAGNVLTETFTTLRDQVDVVYQTFSGAI